MSNTPTFDDLKGLAPGSRFFAVRKRQSQANATIHPKYVDWLEVVQSGTSITAVKLPKMSSEGVITFTSSTSADSGGAVYQALVLDETTGLKRVDVPNQSDCDRHIQEAVDCAIHMMDEQVLNWVDVATSIINTQEALELYASENPNNASQANQVHRSLGIILNAGNVQAAGPTLRIARDFIADKFPAVYHNPNSALAREGTKAQNDLTVCLSVIDYGRDSAASRLPIAARSKAPSIQNSPATASDTALRTSRDEADVSSSQNKTPHFLRM